MKLEISNLTVELNKNRIIDDLTMSVAEGEFISLLGPSGCGKSTLLKTIAGINPVSAGTIMLDGELINSKPAHKRGTVIVFQDMRLFPNMTVAENVAYALRLRGVRRAQRLSRAEELLRAVQLEGLGDRHISSLSGGQMQRVALARALAAEPRLLLLDEPFSSLDENLRQDMRSLVRRLHREFSMTTIMVTHDRQEALDMADRVALMFDGKIRAMGSPREVYDRGAAGAGRGDAAVRDEQIAAYFKDFIRVEGMVRDGIFTASDGSGMTCRMDRPDGPCSMMLSVGGS